MKQQRLCPGKGHRCQAFLAPVNDDPHPTCSRCRGIECDESLRCVICADLTPQLKARWLNVLKTRRARRAQRRRAAARKAERLSHELSSSPSSSFPSSEVEGPSSPASLPSKSDPPPVSVSVCVSSLQSVPPLVGDELQIVPLSGSGVSPSAPVTTASATPWGDWQGCPWMPYSVGGFPWGGQGLTGPFPWGWGVAVLSLLLLA